MDLVIFSHSLPITPETSSETVPSWFIMNLIVCYSGIVKIVIYWEHILMN